MTEIAEQRGTPAASAIEAHAGSCIRLRNVRVHNLKGLSLDLPRDRLVVVTGVSGSGKSSLAFDTLYAEGQRRYIETFSAYIRQFLDKLDKPEADRIDGIPPAISVSQRIARRSARATVGSIANIHDSLALLFARVGQVICPSCSTEVKPHDPHSVERAIDALAAGTKYLITYPLEILPETDRAALTETLRQDGLTRVRVANEIISIDSAELALPASGEIEVVIDRLTRGTEAAGRRLDSIETAFQRGLGRCRVVTDNETLTFYRAWRCSGCGRDFARPDPRLFRPGNPMGACPGCEGFGRTIDLDLARIVPDPSKSLANGAIAPLATPGHQSWQGELLEWAPSAGIPIDRPFKHLSSDQARLILEGDKHFGGLKGFFRWLERKSYKMHVRVFLNRWRGYRTCEACAGTRLRPDALAVRLLGQNIAEISSIPLADCLTFLDQCQREISGQVAGRILSSARTRLRYLERLGLGYLTLDRPARTLSIGESRRVSLTSALGLGLVNTLYVLDEPSIGLHPRDVERLIESLRALRAGPNSVVVVEHDLAVMRAADLLLDIGPGAGDAGGKVVFFGPPERAADAEGSVTGEFLSGRRKVAIPHTRRPANKGMLSLKGARGHNLKNIDVDFPLGLLCVVTGVSGSGKSTLVEDTLYPALLRRLRREYEPGLPFGELRGAQALADVEWIDQTPIGRTPRSNPATYLKAYDEIRKAFATTHEAKLRNYGPGQFSFNLGGGRCNACDGHGYRLIDMQFLSDVMVRCPECHGRRFRAETLEVTYRGKNIAEVLDMTAREAFGFFRNRQKIQMRLRPLLEVGLEYLRLGQPANTLSGGESQRLKLASRLGSSAARMTRASTTLFLLEEPTTGLHPADVVRLLDCLNALVDQGHGIVVIEHNPDVMAAADWIIDLGPEAGAEGGRVVATGTPEVIARGGSHTGRVLAQMMGDRLKDAASDANE